MKLELQAKAREVLKLFVSADEILVNDLDVMRFMGHTNEEAHSTTCRLFTITGDEFQLEFCASDLQQAFIESSTRLRIRSLDGICRTFKFVTKRFMNVEGIIKR